MKKIFCIFNLLLCVLTLFSCTNGSNVGGNEPGENPEITNEHYKQPFGSDGDVYRININTVNNEFPYDKENYIKGSLTVTEQNPTIIKHESMSMKIKLRGNSTMEAPKKPFKIKFEDKQSLFGLTAAKEWVLLANYYDKANIRNFLAYNLANRLDLGFQPSSIFVDVYFNNEYLGLYLLCEQLEAKTGRVDIEDSYSSDGISSFLLEADDRALDEYPGYAGSCYIPVNEYNFALKYPDADDYVDAVKEKDVETLLEFKKNTTWLSSFLNNVYDAVSSKSYNKYSKYIDVESFIDFYIVQELFKNLDIAHTSQYYVIDQSDETVKLKAGPVWDFDLSLGVVDETSDPMYDLYIRTDLFVRERDPFYNYLFKDRKFRQMVSERYTEIRTTLIEPILEEVELIYESTYEAQTRDIYKWPLTNERNTWVEIYALSGNYYAINSLDGHYEHLKKVLKERIELLDDNYLNK